MKKGKLNKNEQSKLKGLSKVICIFAKLGRICICIGIVCMFLCAILVPTAVKHVHNYDNKIVLKYDKESLTIEKNSDDTVSVYNNDKENLKNLELSDYKKIKKVFDKYSKTQLIGYAEALILFFVLYMYLLVLVLKHLGLLFKNINKGQTPFTLDNVDHMKKMGIFMICAIILPPITAVLFDLIAKIDLNFTVSIIDIVQILFVFAMSFVFRYGYNLQEDSSKQIYDEEE